MKLAVLTTTGDESHLHKITWYFDDCLAYVLFGY